MESRHWTGDDDRGADLDNMSDAEFREWAEREHEKLYPNGCPNGCEACEARGCETPLTDDERLALKQANLIADAIRRATTFSN